MSYTPIILAPDSLDSGGDPWSRDRLPSIYSLPYDLWDRDWLQKVPDDFKDARAAVITSIKERNEDHTDSLAAYRLHDDELAVLVTDLLAAYKRWAQTEYSSAIWADVVALVEKQPHADVLENKPTALILSPLHPIRLAWQVNAQSILHNAYYAEKPCPIASELTPHHFPDCLNLPCTTSAGDVERHAFVALHSSNPYWSVLWSLSDLRKLHTRSTSVSILRSLDITVDGLAKGFKESQVKRAIDEVKRLKSAASTLFLTVEGKSGEAASFNSGVLDWVSENLGPDSESNHWKSVGGMALSVSDRRRSESFPELSALSAASELSDGALTWSTFSDSQPTSHLGVITQLSATTETGEKTQLRSGTDLSALGGGG